MMERLSKLGAFLAFAITTGPALAASRYNMPVGVTEISAKTQHLHMTIFWICVAIGIVVFSVMFYAIIMHRKSRGVVAKNFHESTVVEIAWSVVPFMILIGMAIPATKVLIDIEDTSKADLTIKVTGYQWKWHYDYINEDVSFFSNLSTPVNEIENSQPKNAHYLLQVDNPIVVPVNKKVRILTTSNDVNHAWWVPELAVKKDAIPGFINEAWTKIEKPGTYRGQCAELCGVYHGYMPIVLEAKSEADYQEWLDARKTEHAEKMASNGKVWDMEELMVQGEKVFNTVCAACHQVTGTGIPGVFPAIKGSPIVLGDIKEHILLVLNGKTGTAMQAFGPQLSNAELAAVLTYQRNAFGNNTGDIIQPTDVEALR